MRNTRNIALLLFLFVALHSCEPLDSPGGGLGSVADISDYKYKSEYYHKYSDSLFYYCPEFRIPDTIKTGGVEVAYPHLSMTSFYLNSPP
ncbi:MAG: hypothetical protein L6Q81_12870 [Bacteroidia bacterium]|nr:hypothetical protein [Bacteroidia bacterium]